MKTSTEVKEYTIEFLHKLGDLIKSTRKEQGLSLQDVYLLSGISSSVISDLENHKGAIPSIYTLFSILNVLEVPIGPLLGASSSSKEQILKSALLTYGLDLKYVDRVVGFIEGCMSS